MAYIAIDTNIFEHLLNPEMNTASHIDKLLGQLSKMEYQLLVDSTRKIGGEYLRLIVPIIRNMDETRPQLPLLRFWMNPDIRHEVTLNPIDNLMQKIKNIIHEAHEYADRAFVYIVCIEDSVLVTNDHIHILDRRRALLKGTKKFRGRNTDIQSSHTAYSAFLASGGLT